MKAKTMNKKGEAGEDRLALMRSGRSLGFKPSEAAIKKTSMIRSPKLSSGGQKTEINVHPQTRRHTQKQDW